MKRSIGWRFPILVLALFTTVARPLSGQGSSSEIAKSNAGTDLVLLVDVSQSVLPWYRDVTDYLIGPFVKDFLRLGDTFHLLSFGGNTQAEVVQKIETERDIKIVLGRIYLLVPLERNSDFIGALGELGRYVESLTPDRKKVIVIMTDGLQNPDSGSPRFGLSATSASKETEKASAALRALGWPVHYIRLPFGSEAENKSPIPTIAGSGSPTLGANKEVGDDASAKTSEIRTTSSDNGLSPGKLAERNGPQARSSSEDKSTGFPVGNEAAIALGAKVTDWPTQVGQPAAKSTLPARTESPFLALLNSPSRTLMVVVVVVFLLGLAFFIIIGKIPFRAEAPLVDAVKRSAKQGAEILPQKVSSPRKPEKLEPLEANHPVDEKSTRIGRVSASLETNVRSATPDQRKGLGAVTPNQVDALSTPQARIPATKVVKPIGEESVSPSLAAYAPSLKRYTPTIKKNGSLRVELRVGGQNSHIGQRNIHELRSGSSRTVGGRRSDFLIFLVKVPQKVGELHFDGETCVFVPEVASLFPTLDGPVLDCLGKDIPMQSPKGFPLTLRFATWEAPAERINRLLHCIEVPGLFEWKDDNS